MDRICRWYTPDSGSMPSRSSFYRSFKSNISSRLLIPITSFASLFNFWCHGSWTLFCTEKGHFEYFWLKAGQAPRPFNFLALMIGTCVLSFSKSCRVNLFWIGSELLQISLYTLCTKIRCIYGIRSYTVYLLYMEISYTLWANLTNEQCLLQKLRIHHVTHFHQSL